MRKSLNIILGFICIALCLYTFFFLKIGGRIPSVMVFHEMDGSMDYEYTEFDNPEIEPEILTPEQEEKKYIKWMAFDVPLEVLNQALAYDIKSYDSEIPLNWIELISYSVAKNWGKLQDGVKSKDMDELVVKLKKGEKMQDITKNMKLYSFYYETYSALLDGFVGEYLVEQDDPKTPGLKTFVRKYGLKVFSPIGKGYSYSHFDDFGVSRTYGYKRKHQGHDMMGSVGTPIIAVEDGYVEALGWNQYGGWRIGIRSHDKKRYYYYAHLKKDHPYHSSLEIGSYVQAGDVIGYLGMTGYSRNENVNNIKTPHLHFGIQIIFDEVQKDGINQIWLDCYNIVNFLAKNKMPVYRDAATKELNRSIRIENIPVD